MENLAELVTVAREFAGDAAADPGEHRRPRRTPTAPPAPGSLAAFLERVALVADADSIPDSGDGVVTLMTLHTAKGLEFPVVFLHRLGGRRLPAPCGRWATRPSSPRSAGWPTSGSPGPASGCTCPGR